MGESAVLKKNANMVTRAIDNEVILLPVYKSSDEINCIYTLNKVASRVWALIDGKRTVSDIKKQVLDEFDVTPAEAEREMEKFLNELKDINALV